MTKLQWGLDGSRVYNAGLDRGVLYLPSGEAIPWNGLTAIEEDGPETGDALYFDGVKYFDEVTREDFSALLKAYTYPDAFEALEGTVSLENGLSTGGQVRKLFNLSYRTMISSDLDPEQGYKLHILYNLIATPQDISRQTVSDSVSANEFGWKLSATPALISGYAPTAHAIINSTEIRPELLQDLEKLLYGTSTANPAVPPLNQLVDYVRDWNLIQITDNGDGTWTATSNYGYVAEDSQGQLVILDANATYSDPDTYTISDTKA